MDYIVLAFGQESDWMISPCLPHPTKYHLSVRGGQRVNELHRHLKHLCDSNLTGLKVLSLSDNPVMSNAHAFKHLLGLGDLEQSECFGDHYGFFDRLEKLPKNTRIVIAFVPLDHDPRTADEGHLILDAYRRRARWFGYHPNSFYVEQKDRPEILAVAIDRHRGQVFQLGTSVPHEVPLSAAS